MFSSALRAALFALAASAAAAYATPGLSLKVSGDETLKLLNDPRSALNKMPSNTFNITTDSGESPSFVGVYVKYVPSLAVKSTDPKSFTVLAPGESVTVTHDLSSAYDFTVPGANQYTVEASNLFHYVHPETNQPIAIFADAEAHVASLSGKLAAVRPTSNLIDPHELYIGCSADKILTISTAVPAAQSYVASAAAYLGSQEAATPRYTTWFGAYTSSRHSTVLSHFTNIGSHWQITKYQYDCVSCSKNPDAQDAIAYVYPDQFGVIYLCDAFWNLPTTGTDSRAGTLVHESSHFTVNGGTQDYTYGQPSSMSLAKSNPNKAIFNADNHEYFAENTPPLA